MWSVHQILNAFDTVGQRGLQPASPSLARPGRRQIFQYIIKKPQRRETFWDNFLWLSCSKNGWKHRIIGISRLCYSITHHRASAVAVLARQNLIMIFLGLKEKKKSNSLSLLWVILCWSYPQSQTSLPLSGLPLTVHNTMQYHEVSNDHSLFLSTYSVPSGWQEGTRRYIFSNAVRQIFT